MFGVTWLTGNFGKCEANIIITGEVEGKSIYKTIEGISKRRKEYATQCQGTGKQGLDFGHKLSLTVHLLSWWKLFAFEYSKLPAEKQKHLRSQNLFQATVLTYKVLFRSANSDTPEHPCFSFAPISYLNFLLINTSSSQNIVNSQNKSVKD